MILQDLIQPVVVTVEVDNMVLTIIVVDTVHHLDNSRVKEIAVLLDQMEMMIRKKIVIMNQNHQTAHLNLQLQIHQLSQHHPSHALHLTLILDQLAVKEIQETAYKRHNFQLKEEEVEEEQHRLLLANWEQKSMETECFSFVNNKMKFWIN